MKLSLSKVLILSFFSIALIIGGFKINNLRLEKRLEYYVPVSNMVIFPFMHYKLSMPKNASTSLYVNTIMTAYTNKKPILVILKDESSSRLEEYGTLCSITTLSDQPNQIILEVDGLNIRHIPKAYKASMNNTLISQLKTQKFSLDKGEANDNANLMAQIKLILTENEKIKGWFGEKTLPVLLSESDPYRFSNIISHLPNLTAAQEIGILKQNNITKKLEFNLFYLKKWHEEQQLKNSIKKEDPSNNSPAQQDIIISTKIDMNDMEEVLKRLNELELPKVVREKAMEEYEKLKNMPNGHHEKPVSQKLIEYILTLPWSEPAQKYSSIQQIIQKADLSLGESHHALEDIKERIIEYLAISDRLKNKKAPILCFMGPPGVGKTSMAKSIAQSLQRPFVKLALGGVRDEAAIRGHLRTYVGAMPGGIIQQMIQAKAKNPVFLLDEIDKLETNSMQGDPTAALLEVLDPEQNKNFTDHFLGFEYDLSQVLFIATANTLETIPRPLLDRLEIIELSSYTVDEKIQIAQQFLLPKLLNNLNIDSKNISTLLTKEQFSKLITGYTFESGVRELERVIEKLIRKRLTFIIKSTPTQNNTIQPNTLLSLLPFTDDEIAKSLGVPMEMEGVTAKSPGLVNGLVVSGIGGNVMPIEVMATKGRGEVIQTGRLGDVMKESISVAKSIVRSQEGNFGLKLGITKTYDLHIHMPAGAIQKDGPSAGITLVTAMVSAYTHKLVRSDLAMTGEISLSGLVLPIGGVKEKLMAAHRKGIKTVIIPIGNKSHLEKLPKNVLDDLEIVYATTIKDVLKVALK